MSELLFSDRDRSNILADVAQTQQTPKQPGMLEAADQMLKEFTDWPRLVGDAPSVLGKIVGGGINDVSDIAADALLGTNDPGVGQPLQLPVRDLARASGATDVADWIDAQNRQREEWRRALRADPEVEGAAAQVIIPLGQLLLPSIVGSQAAGAARAEATGAAVAGVLTRQQEYSLLQENGVDPYTASVRADLAGGVGFLGGAIPAAFGRTLVQRVASGATANVGLGMVDRFAAAEFLKSSGYDDAAQLYAWADPIAVTVDALLGAGFGGLHHYNAVAEARRTEAAVSGQRDYGAIEWSREASVPDVAQRLDPLEQQIAGAVYEGLIDADTAAQRLAGMRATRTEGDADVDAFLVVLEELGKRDRERGQPTDASNPDIPADLLYAVEERAALYEQGGRTRAEAERLAREDVRENWETLGLPGQPSSEQIAAAFVLADKLRAEIGSAPGVPRTITAAQLQAAAMERAAQQMAEDQAVAIDDLFAQAIAVRGAEAKFTSLVPWLQSRGGLRDEGGEVSTAIGGRSGRDTGVVGLLNDASGLSLDDATLYAWENGYLRGAERPTTDALIMAIREELAGAKVYREADESALADLREGRRIADWFASEGIDITGDDAALRAQIEAFVRAQFAPHKPSPDAPKIAEAIEAVLLEAGVDPDDPEIRAIRDDMAAVDADLARLEAQAAALGIDRDLMAARETPTGERVDDATVQRTEDAQPVETPEPEAVAQPTGLFADKWGADNRTAEREVVVRAQYMKKTATWAEVVDTVDALNEIVAANILTTKKMDEAEAMNVARAVTSLYASSASRMAGDDKLFINRVRKALDDLRLDKDGNPRPWQEYRDDPDYRRLSIIMDAADGVRTLYNLQKAGVKTLIDWDIRTEPPPNAERNMRGNTGIQTRAGFYSAVGRALADMPDRYLTMGGEAVVNWLLKQPNVRREEIYFLGLNEFFGKKPTREQVVRKVRENELRLKRHYAEFDPEKPTGDYDLPVRAFNGPRVPGRGIYFEDRFSFPTRTPTGAPFAPGMFQSPHWGDTNSPNAFASIRGSIREIDGVGTVVLGEEMQADFFQGAQGRGDDWTGRRPWVDAKTYLEWKARREEYRQARARAGRDLNTLREFLFQRARKSLFPHMAEFDKWQNAVAALYPWAHKRNVNGPEFTRDEALALVEAELQKPKQDLDYEPHPRYAFPALEKLVAEQPEFFTIEAEKQFNRTESSFTPDAPLKDRWEDTIIKGMIVRAARRGADAVAISTTETTGRIQNNPGAAKFYDADFKAKLERQMRVLTGDQTLVAELVKLPAKRGQKPYTVWVVRFPEGAAKRIADEGAPLFARDRQLDALGFYSPAHEAALAVPDNIWSMGYQAARDSIMKARNLAGEGARPGDEIKALGLDEAFRGTKLRGAELRDAVLQFVELQRLVLDEAYNRFDPGAFERNAARRAELTAELDALRASIQDAEEAASIGVREARDRLNEKRTVVLDSFIQETERRIRAGEILRGEGERLIVEFAPDIPELKVMSDAADRLREVRRPIEKRETEIEAELRALGAGMPSPTQSGVRRGPGDIRLPGDDPVFELRLKLQPGTPGSDFDSHWSRAPSNDKGVVVSIRGEERLDDAGKRTLFGGEVQSDMAQQARANKDRLDEVTAKLEAIDAALRDAPDGSWFVVTDKAVTAHATKNAADAAALRQGGNVMSTAGVEREQRIAQNAVDAMKDAVSETEKYPLTAKTSQWTNAAVRAVVYRAARDGFDSVSFPTGDTSTLIQGNDNAAGHYDTNVKGALEKVAAAFGGRVRDGGVAYPDERPMRDTRAGEPISGPHDGPTYVVRWREGGALVDHTIEYASMADAEAAARDWYNQTGDDAYAAPANTEVTPPPARGGRLASAYVLDMTPAMRAEILQRGMPMFARDGLIGQGRSKRVYADPADASKVIVEMPRNAATEAFLEFAQQAHAQGLPIAQHLPLITDLQRTADGVTYRAARLDENGTRLRIGRENGEFFLTGLAEEDPQRVSLLEAVKAVEAHLRAALPRGGYYFDLSPQNFMRTADGRFIINDPLEGGDLAPARRAARPRSRADDLRMRIWPILALLGRLLPADFVTVVQSWADLPADLLQRLDIMAAGPDAFMSKASVSRGADFMVERAQTAGAAHDVMCRQMREQLREARATGRRPALRYGMLADGEVLIWSGHDGIHADVEAQVGEPFVQKGQIDEPMQIAEAAKRMGDTRLEGVKAPEFAGRPHAVVNAERAGMQPRAARGDRLTVAQAAQRVLDMLAAREARGTASFSDDRLTATQNKVVELLNNNFTIEEAADEMGISPNTVRSHVRNAKKAAPDIVVNMRGLEAGRTKDWGALATLVTRSTDPTPERIAYALLGKSDTNAASKVLSDARRGEFGPEIQALAELVYLRDVEATVRPDATGRAQVLAMLEQGQSFAQVAAKTGLTRNQVAGIARRAGGSPRAAADLTGLKALADPLTGKVYIIADNVSPRELMGLLVHEIGVHLGLKKLIGDKGYADAMKQLQAMRKAGVPEVVRAFETAEREALLPEHVLEEAFAYLVQNAPEMPLVQRILATLAQWANRFLGTRFATPEDIALGKLERGDLLTVEDMRNLAVAALQRYRADGVGVREAGAFAARETPRGRGADTSGDIKAARETPRPYDPLDATLAENPGLTLPNGHDAAEAVRVARLNVTKAEAMGQAFETAAACAIKAGFSPRATVSLSEMIAGLTAGAAGGAVFANAAIPLMRQAAAEEAGMSRMEAMNREIEGMLDGILYDPERPLTEDEKRVASYYDMLEPAPGVRTNDYPEGVKPGDRFFAGGASARMGGVEPAGADQ